MKGINEERVQEYLSLNPISNSFKAYLKNKVKSKYAKNANMSAIQIASLIAKTNSNDIRHLNMRSIPHQPLEFMWKNGELKLFRWFFFYYCFHSQIETNQLVRMFSLRNKRITTSCGLSSSARASLGSNTKQSLSVSSKPTPRDYGKSKKWPSSHKWSLSSR